jgi:high-affinity Fe2+/Pb2+ permease
LDRDALWADAKIAQNRLIFTAIAGLFLALGAGAALVTGVCLLLLAGHDILATILAGLAPVAVSVSIVALPRLRRSHWQESGTDEGEIA